MSRVGKRPIVVPPGVKVSIAGGEVGVKGPRGELSRPIHPDIVVSLGNGIITVSRPTDGRLHRSMHGLSRTLIANMVEGVSNGFRKDLEIRGVGYRAQKTGDKLVLQVGYSHPVEVAPPPGVSFEVGTPNQISVFGIEKELVGEVAARVRAVRPPEPYHGKGIRYVGEVVRLKAGKSGKVGKRR